MTSYRNLSIKAKLATIALLACVTALTLACAALFTYEVLSFRSSLVRDLKAQATTLAGLSTAALTFDDTVTAAEILGELRNQEHIKWAVIFKQGRRFASYQNPNNTGSLPDEAPYEFGENFLPDGLVLHSEIRLKGERVGTLQLAADSSQLRARLWEYGQILLVVFLASSLVAVLLAALLQRGIVTPVQRLADAAQLIAERQDYSVRVDQGGDDELGRLTLAFNHMLIRIQDQDTELRESRARFEIAVAGARDGIWDWNLATKDVFLSRQWKAMLGYRENEYVPSHESWMGLFVHQRERDNTLRILQEYLSGERPTYEAEFRLRHKEGTHRWILSRGAALRDADGKPYRMAGSHTDITERKLAEEQVNVSRAKFESLVNSINGIVWEADALLSQILFVNGQAERIMGYPVKQWLEVPDFWEGSIHPDDRAPFRRALRRGIAGGKSFQIEHRAIAANGRTVWFSESVSVEKKGNRSVLLRGVAIDITSQKQAAAEIERMQRELVDASRLAGMAEVATGVLHNVGNVLNSVNLSAGIVVEQLQSSKVSSLAKAVALMREHKANLGEYLSNDPKGRGLPPFIEAVSDQLTKEQSRLIRESKGLQKNVEHIKQIVSLQQSFSKVSGAIENLSIADLVEDALRMSSDAMERQQVTLVRQYADVPPVLVDRHVVLQILVNLISNARQALNVLTEGRRVVVRIAQRSSDRVVVEVIDNGMGIPAENLVKIFSYGFTTKKNGHGFGLHSCANAAKKMGGSLHVRSEGAGHGATFVLELPIRNGSTPAGKAGGRSEQPFPVAGKTAPTTRADVIGVSA